MRLQLSGTATPELAPKLITYGSGNVFLKAPYVALGYTRIDVIAIGAGGGQGGRYGYSTPVTGGDLFIYNGGAGGGGGVHRVQALLSALAASVSITIGVPGTDGADGGWAAAGGPLSNSPLATVGTDGSASSFGTLAFASGGKGGGVWSTKSYTGQAPGGAGGLGNNLTAGGGGAGGTASTPDGTDGTWGSGVGQGGGGGAGGTNYGDSTTDYWEQFIDAGFGGAGAYNSLDTSMSAPAHPAQIDTSVGSWPTIDGGVAYSVSCAGPGAGAKSKVLTGINQEFGSLISTLVPNQQSGAGFVCALLT